MKKILASILALAMIFVFVSCDPVAGPTVDNSGVENPIEKANAVNPTTKPEKMGIENLEEFTIFPKEVVDGKTVITA